MNETTKALEDGKVVFLTCLSNGKEYLTLKPEKNDDKLILCELLMNEDGGIGKIGKLSFLDFTPIKEQDYPYHQFYRVRVAELTEENRLKIVIGAALTKIKGGK